MTNDLKNAIYEAAHAAWFNGNVDDAVLAAIEKYDDLVNKDFKIPKKEEKEDKSPVPRPQSENVIFLKETDNDVIRIFDSLPQLIRKLSSEHHCIIAIRDDFDSSKFRNRWPNPNPLLKVHRDSDGIFHIDECIGFYGFQSVRKG